MYFTFNPIKIDAIKYGRNSLLKLTPPANIAIISVLYAIFDVKNITEIKANSGVNRLAKYGIKFT